MIERAAVARLPVTVAIPTYGRESVLLDTVRQFLDQKPAASEILIVDQTQQHEVGTESKLRHWHEIGRIRWIRRKEPSQPGALNVALLEATQPIVLFLDDDIRIETGFVAAHAGAFHDEAIWAVVGQVLQPDESELVGYTHVPDDSPLADLEFPFRSGSPARIRNGMSGNMSVRRDRAIALGGFDENFLPPVSYRFDSDFCKRLVQAGGEILFEPRARIYHLRAERGGTRSQGSHVTSASPMHGVGDYYFALRRGLSCGTLLYLLRRPVREVRTRFHLRHPWWIPVKLFGEARALVLALRLWLGGPRYLSASSQRVSSREGIV